MPLMFYLVHRQFLNHPTSSLHSLRTIYTTLEVIITIISYHMHLTLWGGCDSSSFKVLQMLRLCSKKSKTISNLVFGYFSIVHGNENDQIEAVLVDIFVWCMLHCHYILCSFKLLCETLCAGFEMFQLAPNWACHLAHT